MHVHNITAPWRQEAAHVTAYHRAGGSEAALHRSSALDITSSYFPRGVGGSGSTGGIESATLCVECATDGDGDAIMRTAEMEDYERRRHERRRGKRRLT